MRIDTRAFRRVFVLLMILEAVAFAAVFIPRPALNDGQWQFLERQRPKFVPGEPVELFTCADCLDFAVFRRGIGGWETRSANILQLANLPAFVAAHHVFSVRQWQPSGTSKQHSDLATIVLVVTVFVECAALAVPFCVRTKRQAANTKRPFGSCGGRQRGE